MIEQYSPKLLIDYNTTVVIVEFGVLLLLSTTWSAVGQAASTLPVLSYPTLSLSAMLLVWNIVEETPPLLPGEDGSTLPSCDSSFLD